MGGALKQKKKVIAKPAPGPVCSCGLWQSRDLRGITYIFCKMENST